MFSVSPQHRHQIYSQRWVSRYRIQRGERSVSFYARRKQALLRWVPEKWEIKTGKLIKVGEASRREEYQKENFFLNFVFKAGFHKLAQGRLKFCCPVFYFIFCCCDKIVQPKSTWEGQANFRLQLTVPLWRKSRQEPADRNQSRDHRQMLLPGLLFLACSACLHYII